MMTRIRYDDRIMIDKIYAIIGKRNFTVRNVENTTGINKNDLQRLKAHGGIIKVGVEGKRHSISTYKINMDKIS